MNFIYLAINSFTLDLEFLFKSFLSPTKKLELILIKYLLVFKHLFIKFELGKSNFKLNGKTIYYASPLYGIASIQAMHSIHYPMIKTAKIKNLQTIFDVGASVGNFSLMLRQLNPSSKIFCFEPLPNSFITLQKNFDKDINFKAYNLALSNTTNQSTITDNFETSSISSQGTIPVKTDTLDNIFDEEKLDKIDLLKIDTETHEAHVLRSATSALAKTHYILIEIMIAKNPNYTISSLLSLLHSPTYNFQLVSQHDYYLNNKPENLTMIDCLFENILFSEPSA
jgi:FkbM family methyltransferase